MDKEQAFAAFDGDVATDRYAFYAGWTAAEADIAEQVRLAQEQAWNEGRASAFVDVRGPGGYFEDRMNPYTQGDKQA